MSYSMPPTQDEAAILESQAQQSIESIWADAYCLTFEDEFEADILKVSHILHAELRPLLQLGATIETCGRIERCSEVALGLLFAWTVRNQLVSRRAQAIAVEVPSPSVEKLMFKNELLDLPTAAGCEVNFETALKVEQYVTKHISALFTTSVFKHDTGFDLDAAQRIRATLTALRKRSATVTSSAKAACLAAARLRPLLPDFLATTTAEKELVGEDVRVREEKEARYEKLQRALRPLKSLFGPPKVDLEAKRRIMVLERARKRLSLLEEYVAALKEAGTQPRLAALPPISVVDLQQARQGVWARFGAGERQGQEETPKYRAEPARKDSVVAESPAEGT